MSLNSRKKRKLNADLAAAFSQVSEDIDSGQFVTEWGEVNHYTDINPETGNSWAADLFYMGVIPVHPETGKIEYSTYRKELEKEWQPKPRAATEKNRSIYDDEPMPTPAEQKTFGIIAAICAAPGCLLFMLPGLALIILAVWSFLLSSRTW